MKEWKNKWKENGRWKAWSKLHRSEKKDGCEITKEDQGRTKQGNGIYGDDKKGREKITKTDWRRKK